jgi:hypothetical protein
VVRAACRWPWEGDDITRANSRSKSPFSKGRCSGIFKGLDQNPPVPPLEKGERTTELADVGHGDFDRHEQPKGINRAALFRNQGAASWIG